MKFYENGTAHTYYHLDDSDRWPTTDSRVTRWIDPIIHKTTKEVLMYIFVYQYDKENSSVGEVKLGGTKWGCLKEVPPR